MKQQELIAKIRSVKGVLDREYGIETLALFGSRARNDGTESSDVDLVILQSRDRDYFKRVSAKYFLENILRRKVDLGYFDAIRPVIRKRIEKEMIRV